MLAIVVGIAAILGVIYWFFAIRERPNAAGGEITEELPDQERLDLSSR
jgi:hypothetical protein